MLGIGIVGLPNVGKSTLFNAITNAKAEAANYPFCTIDPNVGIVNLPDGRLDKVAEVVKAKKTVYSTVKFVDIAGLVKGASKGEGLGNKFLSHIREVSAICQVVRCFEDKNILHVEGSIDPIRDIEIINNELIFSDINTVETALEKNKKMTKGRVSKEVTDAIELFEKLYAHLSKFEFLSTLELNDKEQEIIRPYQLLTMKPMLFVANVKEEEVATGNDYVKALETYAFSKGIDVTVISSKIEEELSAIVDKVEKAEFLSCMGLEEPGLNKIVRSGYKLLGLSNFFTAGEVEARAWTINRDETALEAAAEIHTDIKRGFIRAEVVAYDDFVNLGGWAKAKEKGVLRLEGKDYIVKDADVIYFRFNV